LNEEYEKAWDDFNKAQNLRLKIHPEFIKSLRKACTENFFGNPFYDNKKFIKERINETLFLGYWNFNLHFFRVCQYRKYKRHVILHFFL
jgi:hypothetical protein